jgi:hypothetical protein
MTLATKPVTGVSNHQRHCEERLRRGNPALPGCPGLLRGACHRARIRATRWLAMTVLDPLNLFARVRFALCILHMRPRVNSGAVSRENAEAYPLVMPAQAGIQYSEAPVIKARTRGVLDTRLRGYDEVLVESGNCRAARPHPPSLCEAPSPTTGEGRKVTPPRPSPPAPGAARASIASGSLSWSRQNARGYRLRTR